MDDNPKLRNPRAVYAFIITAGAVLVLIAYIIGPNDPTNTLRQAEFLQNLLVNIGSNLIVITILFATFAYLGDRQREERPQEVQSPVMTPREPIPSPSPEAKLLEAKPSEPVEDRDKVPPELKDALKDLASPLGMTTTPRKYKDK